MPKIESVRLTDQAINEELIDSGFRTYIYKYLITSAELMKSKNQYLLEAQKESKYKLRLIVSEPDPEKEKIEQMHKDVARALNINGKKLPLDISEADLRAHLHEAFGDNLPAILSHYSQLLSYYLFTPLNVYFTDPDKTSLFLRAGDERTENIFSHEKLAIRTVEQFCVYIYVPDDKKFILPERLEQYKAAKNQKTKEGIDAQWRGWWKFRSDIKVLSRAIPEGFEILGIGTDTAVIAAMYLDNKDSLKLFNEMIDTIVKIEKESIGVLKHLLDKAAPESKLTNVKLLIRKINDFKTGQVTFERFVQGMSDLYRISLTVPHTGFVSVALSKFGVEKESGTSVALKEYSEKLSDIEARMEESVKLNFRAPIEDTSADIDFKAKLDDIQKIIRDYIDSPGRDPTFFSTLTISSRVLHAELYIDLLEQTNAPLGKAIIIHAILNGNDEWLKNIVVETFGRWLDEEKVKAYLTKVIKTSVEGEPLQETALKLVDRLTDKIQRSDNTTEEMKTIKTLEENHSQRIRPLPPSS